MRTQFMRSRLPGAPKGHADTRLLCLTILAVLTALLAWSAGVIWADAPKTQPPSKASPIAATPAAPASPTANASPARAEYVGRDVCLGCHEDKGRSFDMTDHAKVPGAAPNAANQCESCHGPGSEHVNSGGGVGVGIINPARLEPQKAAALCTRCHEGRRGQYAWRFSKHANNAVSCLDCHYGHPKSKQDVSAHQIRKGGEPKVCYTCHTEVKAEVNWPSHHPIPEKRMVCTDCHNPHGSDLTAFKDAPNARELCLKCHAQYRGPFANEHQPVSEDCTHCHKPHGSFENRLLVASEPFLCLRCHSAIHNPHVPTILRTSDQLAAQALQFSRCSTCHSNVHGSEQDPRLVR